MTAGMEDCEANCERGEAACRPCCQARGGTVEEEVVPRTSMASP